MNKSLLALVVLALLPGLGGRSWGKVIYHWDFDEKDPLHDLVIQGDKPEIVDDPKKPGNKVMRSVLRPKAKRPERSEVMPESIKVGEDRWVGVRMMRTSEVQSGFNCFFQLGPVDGDKKHEGGGLYQLNCYDQESWTFRGFHERVGREELRVYAGPINFGKWDDWVFHVKLRADREGLIEVWRNGKLVMRNAGQNAYPAETMRIKWGVYVSKGGAVPGEISCYYDDITIGDAESSYKEVVPGSQAAKKESRKDSKSEKESKKAR